MANNRIVFQGMEEFRIALRDLPRELAEEGNGIVLAAAEQAKSGILAGYPEVSGNLKKNVRLKVETSPFGTLAELKSSAHHAYLYEYGSEVERMDRGMSRGMMPGRKGGPLFIPVAVRKRRAMNDALKALLVRAGFVVSGAP